MDSYRIDDLARMADTTVRNVRAFQERGLLPPPRMKGRTGYYDDSHLARIRVIGNLQERGFTLASIGEMLSAWESGHNLADVLGVERVLTEPWSGEEPEYLSISEVVEIFVPGLVEDDFAGKSPELFPMLARAEELGFIRWAGDRFEVPSPRLFRVGVELHAAGVPLSSIYDIAGELRADCATIADRFVALAVKQADLEDPSQLAARADLPEIAKLIARLRPLGMEAIQGMLAQELHARIQAAFSDRIETFLDLLPKEVPLTPKDPGPS
ncbi:zinc-responsive transcriptional regulator [Actinomadura rubteroloni]|uniref:Zinc-responsive transcriptional regulator n=1 Tax=Actinomadura rubteroloni TaxID=1926885 RepID=A0A2P4UIR5_9ACTN|nr:MerR family transcriptional regulator [Actinomadura rubteroloni]POM24952.1 zinc-responsive transcriptional regulator [Actinomadura rubteroloni]